MEGAAVACRVAVRSRLLVGMLSRLILKALEPLG
jgi:hypothetical protein